MNSVLVWLLSASVTALISNYISKSQPQRARANEIPHVSRHRRSKDAFEYAVHKATGKRNVRMLVNLLVSLLTLDSLEEE
jgi:hypothetical protein